MDHRIHGKEMANWFVMKELKFTRDAPPETSLNGGAWRRFYRLFL